MKFAFAFISSCLVFSNILLVDGRRLMNSVGNSAGRKCTINEITSRSVDDFCNELSEIMDFRTQMSEIKKSLAEISSTLDVLSKATSTTPEPTDINQDCEGVWSPCTSSCETAGNRTFQISHPQLGAGKPCQDATDCLSGEDECADANTMKNEDDSSKTSLWWLAVLITGFVVTCACVIFLDVMYKNKTVPVNKTVQDGDSTRGTRFPCNLSLHE